VGHSFILYFLGGIINSVCRTLQTVSLKFHTDGKAGFFPVMPQMEDFQRRTGDNVTHFTCNTESVHISYLMLRL
jgi:hypothetical protein